MSYSISGTDITLTRGDTLKALVRAEYQDGTDYVPQEGDKIRFACKERYTDRAVLIEKDIPTDTMILVLNPEDTEHLEFGRYVYDIQLTRANGDVDTFITKAKLKIAEEVD